MRVSMSDFVDLLDDLADQFVEAAIMDFSDEETRELVNTVVDQRVSKLLGINVNTPFIKPFYSKGKEFVVGNALDFVGLAASSPPESVDAARDVLKENLDEAHAKTNTKIDSLSEKLKQKLAQKASTPSKP
jgi:hypothetical protein